MEKSPGNHPRGNEVVLEMKVIYQLPNPQIPHWPATEAGFTLKDLYGDGGLENGIYVEGQVLAFSWQLINADPRNPLVEDGGEIYMLTLRIPNLLAHLQPNP